MTDSPEDNASERAGSANPVNGGNDEMASEEASWLEAEAELEHSVEALDERAPMQETIIGHRHPAVPRVVDPTVPLMMVETAFWQALPASSFW